ncbi:MAG TPA: M20/M25/M40 family metallo-hydrolase [Phycisphaerales bacterium]|nr:M20/M25/M40 family metallo-hydrolase [Phycisphaerales bacterium]
MNVAAVLVACGVMLGAGDAGSVARTESRDEAAKRSLAGSFAAARIDEQLRWESGLNEAASAERLRAWHDLLASEPHISGSPGDMNVIASLAGSFEKMGLEVEVQWIWPYLSVPVESRVELVAPEAMALVTVEPALAGDPFTQNAALLHGGWNAYSASGDITANVVYANYATKEDFEKLKEMGVECAGKIVVARYGGNFRGSKEIFARKAGAAGLIIFTDPGDAGYAKGPMYPEGGWATSTQIQRGSLLALDRAGDPLTPGIPATENAKRVNPDDLDLPKIPVQPVGWAAAQEILSRMKGKPVPDGWQGGLPFTYRLTSAPEGEADALRVRLKVEQKRGLVKTANVVATMKGTRFPDEMFIIGCHHDAWGYGAADPTCGTILVLEAARCFSEMAKQGLKPERTLVFAAWGAEEHGIIGSTEWVEAHRAELESGALAYVNLDMAAMGPMFGASATPSLRRLIIDATKSVPQARDPSKSVYEDWMKRSATDAAEPKLGELGGGSDHVAFYSWLGIPSMSLGSGGSRGTSYHSIYDNLHWYRLVVGEDYEPALMLTRVINVVAARLANADIPALNVGDLAKAVEEVLRSVPGVPEALKGTEMTIFKESIKKDDVVKMAVERIQEMQRELATQVESIAKSDEKRREVSRALRAACCLADRNDTTRWHRNWWAIPDPDSGYGAVTVPGVRASSAKNDPEALGRDVWGVFEWMEPGLDELHRVSAGSTR